MFTEVAQLKPLFFIMKMDGLFARITNSNFINYITPPVAERFNRSGALVIIVIATIALGKGHGPWKEG